MVRGTAGPVCKEPVMADLMILLDEQDDEVPGVTITPTGLVLPPDLPYIVRSSHSTQSNPYTIEEVRRILLLHAADDCRRMPCGQPPATVSIRARPAPRLPQLVDH